MHDFNPWVYDDVNEIDGKNLVIIENCTTNLNRTEVHLLEENPSCIQKWRVEYSANRICETISHHRVYLLLQNQFYLSDIKTVTKNNFYLTYSLLTFFIWFYWPSSKFFYNQPFLFFELKIPPPQYSPTW